MLELESQSKEDHRKPIVLNFKLTDLNPSSSRRFIEIITILEDYRQEFGLNVNVNWFYKDGDERMQKVGGEYAESTELPFRLIKIER